MVGVSGVKKKIIQINNSTKLKLKVSMSNIQKHQKYCINIKRNLKGLLRKTKANL